MRPHDPQKSLPPLAPGPGRSIAPQSHRPISRTKKNSTACLACKAAKRKCSGEPGPCKACVGAHTEEYCQFDRTKDLRRKVAVKKTIQDLTSYKDLLDSLLTTIRSGETGTVDTLVDMIKSGRPLKEVASFVGCDVTDFRDPSALSFASQSISEDGDNEPDGAPPSPPESGARHGSVQHNLPIWEGRKWQISPHKRLVIHMHELAWRASVMYPCSRFQRSHGHPSRMMMI
ncbi:hypothetical protein N7470_001603 [Penicillium chermesinum]|nr:hypothetical protein N7470_001603 [Penicillium chermesinum]